MQTRIISSGNLRTSRYLSIATANLLVCALIGVIALSVSMSPRWVMGEQEDAKPSLVFEQDILPILKQHCHSCHGSDTRESGLDLRTASSTLRGANNGAVIAVGQPDQSILLELVKNGEMPPDKDSQLEQHEIDALQQWIEQGATAQEPIQTQAPAPLVNDDDRSYWAFQKPHKRSLPSVEHAHRVRTPIDTLILSRQEPKDLTFSVDATRLQLLRRAYFGLLGLPPSPAEADKFLSDQRPNAYERELDRLLASPHYGERWGRHWLDAAGYVDVRLFDGDLTSVYVNEGVWRYRDYVVQSFNQDKSYDQFITEQLAGDELSDWDTAETLSPEVHDQLVATGFLRQIEDHSNDTAVRVKERYDILFGVMQTVSTSLLGMNLECARCHDHKYDPIPQRDYYRLMSCFEPALNVHQWLNPPDRFLADVSLSERKVIDEHNAKVAEETAEIDKKIKELEESETESSESDTPETESPDSDTPEAEAADADKKEQEVAKLKQQRDELNKTLRSYGKIQALWEHSDPPTSRVLRRGNYLNPGVVVEPGFLEVLSPPRELSLTAATPTRTASSGRRLTLAKWLTKPDSTAAGLVARVFINRVWHHHFGVGIVKTVGNFGQNGSRPTHPHLLDWLAVDFMKHDWSLKRIHQMILSSTVFRQQSQISESHLTALSVDPENKLLWRMNLRRLEAEIVRDAVLAASGKLDRTPGGEPVMITTPVDGMSQVKAEPTPSSHWRRTVYIFTRRTYPLRFLETLDFPIMAVNCTNRVNSATVLQSFAFLNGPFVIEHAEHLATRIGPLPENQPTAEIRQAYLNTLSRSPTSDETEKCRKFLAAQSQTYLEKGAPIAQAQQAALTDLCQMLLSTNEFLYIE